MPFALIAHAQVLEGYEQEVVLGGRKINLNTLHMKTLRLLLLASLILMMGNSAFCQTRHGSSKARKTTVAKTPSAALIKGCNGRLVNYYFFNYEAGSHEADIAFKAANASGKGIGVLYIPYTEEKTTFNYRIHADGNIYITMNGITKKLLFISTPESMILNGIASQREYSPEKYEELMSLISPPKPAASKNLVEDDSEEKSTSVQPATPSVPSNNTHKALEVVEEMPSFPGGQEALKLFIATNLHYPVVAQENGVQGRVIVSFIVETDGSITNVQIAGSVDPALDNEACRIVKPMPKWKPGKQDGVPVRVKYNVPVVFRLQ